MRPLSKTVAIDNLEIEVEWDEDEQSTLRIWSIDQIASVPGHPWTDGEYRHVVFVADGHEHAERLLDLLQQQIGQMC